MSFVDLATLTLHRRNEMEARINILLNKCDQAIDDIQKLKLQSKGFIQQLNCEPAELKERFLNCMRQLDEYIYLITDFNLSIGKLEECNSSVEYAPVMDNSHKTLAPIQTYDAYNLMDALSEPVPSTSIDHNNVCKSEKLKHKIPKEEQSLIVFSSASCSSESISPNKNIKTIPTNSDKTKDKETKSQNDNAVSPAKVEKEIQCEVEEDMNNLSLKGQFRYEICNLPAQTVLQTERMYPATIMNIDGASFWVITDNTDELCSFMTEMTNFYKKHNIVLTVEDVKKLTYCAYYDDENDCFYRALFIRVAEEHMNVVEVFLVDTGEVRSATVDCIQPLAPMFYGRPPAARCCHLAGVELLNYDDEDFLDQQDDFMKQYIGKPCIIEVDDNTSESLGVYVILPSNQTVNEVLVERKFAVPFEKSPVEMVATSQDESETLKDELDITKCPEYEDPVEAVTGYHSRDEADICKHYTGGPEKTCFKGSRCKKRHVVKHPDGWTLDRVEVPAKCKSLPLPEPDTWHKVLVTYVCHFDRMYVQFVEDRVQEEVPKFGVVLPPMTLEALVRDMNSPASRLAYKQLKVAPAPGELVAALYPLDEQWYRAKVLSTTRADQSVEVMYIDYGNVIWVKENAVRALEARHAALPAQAALCRLAGVQARDHCSRHWAAARRTLAQLAQHAQLHAHVVCRDYDELTVELYDSKGNNIAEKLAETTEAILLTEYTIVNDTNVTSRIVVP